MPALKIQVSDKRGRERNDLRKSHQGSRFRHRSRIFPAGATTFVAWHTNLRQAYDHIKEMRHHPSPRCVKWQEKSSPISKQKYPSSFGYKEYPAEEEYIEKSMADSAYFDDPSIKNFLMKSDLTSTV